jgi:2-iminobutanoate/2-iminopropanoate deaminase
MTKLVILLSAILAVIGISWFAQAQTPAPTFEKKEFIHSAWTNGLFSEAVTVTGFGNGKMIFLAGVGAEDENGPRGNVRHKDNMEAQCVYAYDKIKRVLAAHGASLADVVKVTAYLTDNSKKLDYIKCYIGTFAGSPLPAKTLVNISQLAFPEMMVEVDVTAITKR